ncbi:universal stress protein [Nonomuraea gerenzanensis]|uniref:Universal stress protein family n=1 Tax=Nonomuraea gerenzanensis TaxID=93944 RepID=A0A1M4EE15_9ACTN|nr:universal stress protein [Nonomuraea gerenzanensis]UBU08764.1 universal stress protein [Nonomuraea gerenzanensis]SBO97129.1 Universal stress protein family [Nonomuraea gerenzanensis]
MSDLGVVVGFDGSLAAREALRWGGAEAAGRGVPLTVCHAWDRPHRERPGEVLPLELVRRPAQRLVKAAAAWAGRHHPGVPVNTLIGRGSPSALLTDLSADAELIVVGSREHGERRGLTVGSVSGHVASRARCPVIVMHGDPVARGARDVLVGFDGSPEATGALGFAAVEAYLLETRLQVLIAQRERGGARDVAELGVQAQGSAWNDLVSRQRAFPGLEAGVEVVDEPARGALLEAARKACLLVVGARGLGEARGLLLGSVSQAMVHHAPCPVAVVR